MDPRSQEDRLVRWLARALLGGFYRRIEVVGQVPASGPLIVAANHHNSVVDALLLLAISPRRLRTLANAPLFRHPLLGPPLRAMGALPVHRRQEAGDDPARNAELFAATTSTLRAGGAILIFPEGRTQPEPVLLQLRTGAARMLLAAEAGDAALHVTLLPVGLVFHEPGRFREGRALVLVGQPVETADLRGAAPERAAREITDRLSSALRARIVEAGDRRTLRLLGLVEELRREGAGDPPDEPARVAWLQQAMGTYRRLRDRREAPLQACRQELERLAEDLDRLGLTNAQLSRRYAPGIVASFALRQGFALLVGAPLALCGLVLHGLPYRATALVVRSLHRTDEEEATDKIVAGLLLYPLAWAVEGWAALRLGGAGGLAAFLALLLPAAFCALSWKERFGRVAREARALLRLLFQPSLLQGLRARRDALATQLEELATLDPEVQTR